MAKRKRQHGTIDRIEEDTVVVVTHDPESSNDYDTVEIYVPKDKFKGEPKEGDSVTVDVE